MSRLVDRQVADPTEELLRLDEAVADGRLGELAITLAAGWGLGGLRTDAEPSPDRAVDLRSCRGRAPWEDVGFLGPQKLLGCVGELREDRLAPDDHDLVIRRGVCGGPGYPTLSRTLRRAASLRAPANGEF